MYGYFLHGKTKPTQQSLSIREHFPQYDETGFGSLIEKSILGTSPRRISPKVANWKLINLLVIGWILLDYAHVVTSIPNLTAYIP